MTPTVITVLVIIALILAIVAAIGKAPIWIAVLLLCIVELIRVLPLGK
jgi:hypothetical protein